MDIAIRCRFTCGLLVGGGAVQLLHAQSKPPAYVVAEVAVKDKEGFEENFLKATRKDITDHGGKYLAGGALTASMFANSTMTTRLGGLAPLRNSRSCRSQWPR